MLTLAILAVVATTLAAGAYLGSGRVARSTRLQVLCACWPLVAGVVIWQLAHFASNTNDEGGDITAQLLLDALALLQLPLFGLAALAGCLFRLAGTARRRILLGLAALAATLVALIAAGGLQVGGATGHPRPLPGGDDSLPGTDYGTDVRAASAAAPVPILWLGPSAFGHRLSHVSLTTYTKRYPTFGPTALIDYDERGTIQISEGLADSTGRTTAS